MEFSNDKSLLRAEMEKIMKIIMLGAPGAGKGTQAKMIAEKYSIPHVSTGDIFRANIKNGTELGMEAKKYMDQGLLVPDELTVKILLDRVSQDDCKNGYVPEPFLRQRFWTKPFPSWVSRLIMLSMWMYPMKIL